MLKNNLHFKEYKFFHDGECLTKPDPDCGLIDCPFESKPICALPDGFCGPPLDFDNSCLMESHNCFNPNSSKTFTH